MIEVERARRGSAPRPRRCRSQRLFSVISWKIRCQPSLSATYTMPRKIRRLVWRAEDRRAQDAVEQRVGARVVEQDQLARLPRARLAEMRLEPALPVAVPERRRARRDRELLRHEVVVRDRVGGEVREVAERERAQRLVRRAVVDLEPDRPRVAVPARRHVLLRDARVGRDRPVQEIVRERAQQLGDRRRQQRQRAQHRLAEEDVRARRPRVAPWAAAATSSTQRARRGRPRDAPAQPRARRA